MSPTPERPLDPQADLPASLGGPEVILAADDEIFDELCAALAKQDLGGLPIRVVRSRELSDPARQSDFHFGRYVPSAPGRVQVLTFVNLGGISVVEQDLGTGAVYRNAELVWANAPLAVANVSSGAAELHWACDAALYFRDGSFRRITTLPNILLVTRAFVTRALDAERGERIEEDWIEIAREALGAPGAGPRRRDEAAQGRAASVRLGGRTDA